MVHAHLYSQHLAVRNSRSLQVQGQLSLQNETLLLKNKKLNLFKSAEGTTTENVCQPENRLSGEQRPGVEDSGWTGTL